jgi:hypothetical protein
MTTQTSAPLAWRSRNSWRSPMPRLRRSTLLGLGLRALVHEVEHRAPHHLGRRVAEHARHLLVDQRGPAVLVDGPHALQAGGHDLSIEALALGQRLVAAEAQDLGRSAARAGREERLDLGVDLERLVVECRDDAQDLAAGRAEGHPHVGLDAVLDQPDVGGERLADVAWVGRNPVDHHVVARCPLERVLERRGQSSAGAHGQRADPGAIFGDVADEAVRCAQRVRDRARQGLEERSADDVGRRLVHIP